MKITDEMLTEASDGFLRAFRRVAANCELVLEPAVNYGYGYNLTFKIPENWGDHLHLDSIIQLAAEWDADYAYIDLKERAVVFRAVPTKTVLSFVTWTS